MYFLVHYDFTIDMSPDCLFLLQKHFKYRVVTDKEAKKVAMTIDTSSYLNREDETEFISTPSFNSEDFSDYQILTDNYSTHAFASRILKQFNYSIYRAVKFI